MSLKLNTSIGDKSTMTYAKDIWECYICLKGIDKVMTDCLPVIREISNGEILLFA